MRILCIGQIVADVMVWPVEAVSYQTDTLCVDRFELHNGGDAMNVAVNLARLGVNAVFSGCVGDDFFGTFLRQTLETEKVDTGGLVKRKETGTSATVVLVNRAGERTFIHCPAANNVLCPNDIPDSLLACVDMVYVGGTFILPGLDGEGTADIFRRARKMGKITAMDVTHDPQGRWMSLIQSTLTELDYFLPSIKEARAITGREQPEEIAEVLRGAGVQTVVIKLGEQGCYVQSATERFYQPALAVEAVDTTGAGDAFVAAFMAGLTQQFDLRTCAAMGCKAGALTVQTLGATSKRLTEMAIRLI